MSFYVILALTLSTFATLSAGSAKGKGKDLFIVEILRPEPALK